jgi:hypothetical protein
VIQVVDKTPKRDDVFKKPTVLVLGAGASTTYGYPTGEMLVNQIVSGDENNLEKQLRRDAGYTDELMNTFRRELRLASVGSVDSFLEHRGDYREIGKFLIAHRLVRLEDLDILHRTESQEPRKDFWYPRLLGHLFDGRTPLSDNKISIITFNYDRSLEQFLHTAIKHRVNWSDEKTAEQLTTIPIVHVHGSLGSLPWQSSDGRPYGNTTDIDTIQRAADSINIVSDTVDETKEFRQARELLEEAEFIFFFGFGYGQANMRRLNIKEILGHRRVPRRQAFGTAVGTTGIERDILDKTYPGIAFDRNDWKIISTMRNLGSFMEAVS